MRAASYFGVLCLISLSAACSGAKTKHNELSGAERARLFIEVANAALLEGDPTGALEQCARAEAEDSNVPEIYHTRALAYAAKGDMATALQSAQRAVHLKPDYSDANNTYGKLLLDAGRYEEAIAPLERAAHDPLNREAYKAYTNLGVLQYRRGRLSDARAELDHAIQAAPEVACVAYYYRGHIHLKQAGTAGSGANKRELGGAVADYTSASKRLCGGFTEAHLALAIAYEQERQYPLARQKFLEIEKRYPDSKFAEQAMNHLRTLP